MNILKQTHDNIQCFGIADILIVVVLAAGAMGSIPAMRAATPSTVVIRRDAAVIARYPLGEDRRFIVEGAEGPLDIQISKQGVAVLHSTCRNQVCVHTGRVGQAFRPVICAPNHVIIEITAPSTRDTIDARTR